MRVSVPPKLGIRTLVKVLREIDIEGAPVLFHAASSRRKHSCFRTVHHVVDTVLGKGGLMEQVEAVDRLGRGILMHAARSNHVNTFNDIYCIVMGPTGFIKHRNQPATESGANASALQQREVLVEVDCFGMNCLHHAAEAGSSEVLREVMRKCHEAEVYQEVNKADKNGRTPIIFALRNGCSCGRRGLCGEIPRKFNMLYKAMPYGPASVASGGIRIGWMETSPVPPYILESKNPNAQAVSDTRAVTELMHAARGSLVSLELALKHSLPASVVRDAAGFTVDLDKALAVECSEAHGSWVQTADTRTWGRAMLLSAAAKLGDVYVLKHVLNAIEVSRECFEAATAWKGFCGAYFKLCNAGHNHEHRTFYATVVTSLISTSKR